ncbi:hypothetical protein H8356DRAFT_1346539 [Neocallimastix lanati (nom. inval.)]|nr:hypothetical protein H8356DRAFT_1346539 [Neocallimastix sp. JGI-2020a]
MKTIPGERKLYINDDNIDKITENGNNENKNNEVEATKQTNQNINENLNKFNYSLIESSFGILERSIVAPEKGDFENIE